MLGRSRHGSAHRDKGVGRNGWIYTSRRWEVTNLDCHVGILGHPGHARHDPPVRLPLVPGTEHRLVRPRMLPAAAVRRGGQRGRARGDEEEEEHRQEGDKGGNDWEDSGISSHGPTSDYCFVARGGGGGGVAVAVGARRSPRCLYPTSSSSSSGAVGMLAHWRSACPLLPSPGASRRREASRTLAINTAA